MTTLALERDPKQREEALHKANTFRTLRSRMKRELKAGRADVAKLIQDPPEYMQGMKLWDFLVSLPRHGQIKVNKIMQRMRISPVKTIGGLTERQRREIVRYLQ
jgi:hypothetical protein